MFPGTLQIKIYDRGSVVVGRDWTSLGCGCGGEWETVVQQSQFFDSGHNFCKLTFLSESAPPQPPSTHFCPL